MKIRSGFVSNSSSSSYVIAFVTKPDSWGHLWERMFPEGDMYLEDWGRKVSTPDLARNVYELILAQGTPATKKEIAAFVRGIGDLDSGYRSPPINEDYATNEAYEKAHKAHWDSWQREVAQNEKAIVNNFWKANKGSYILCCTFSDHNSLDIFLHNGEGLSHFPHLFLSQH